jgi:ABC-type spermidine/putrescine transport system permease subunit I
VYPVGKMFMLSFSGSHGVFTNYHRYFITPAYLKVLWYTIEISLVVTFTCLVLAYPVAYMLANSKGVKRQYLMIAVVIPFIISYLVRTYSWMVILGRQGPVNKLLIWLGLISEPVKLLYTKLAVYVGITHLLLPFMIFTLYSVMNGIDRSLLLAAANLGAGPIRAFISVYLPLSFPGIGAGCVLVFIICVGYYITPALLGGPKDVMISLMIEDQIMKIANWEFGATIAVILFVIVFAFLIGVHFYFGLNRIFTGIGGGQKTT